VPILVKASELLNIADVDTLLKSYFGSPDVQDRFGTSVLFVDALDEVSSSHHNVILERAQEFARSLDCSLVLTQDRGFENSTERV
jgi:hypothetical protein